METLAERLAWARKQKGWTQARLAKEAEVLQSSIGNLEAGIRKTSRSIAALAAALGVDALWLERGKSSEDYFTEIREASRKAAEAERKRIEAERDVTNEAFVQIPKVELQLTAGTQVFAVSPVAAEGNAVWFPTGWLTARGYSARHLIATEVKGPSMEPGLFEGDTIIFNTADTTPKDGAIFAVNYEGECVIKRLIRDAGTWWLSSDNPDQRRFPRKECSGDSCIILGRVVHKQSEVL